MVSCLRSVLLVVLVMSAACSLSPAFPDAGVDASPLPLQSYTCQAELACAASEYCMTLWPGVCGGTPADKDGNCPLGCALCPSGDECNCPAYECRAIPADCIRCECLQPAGAASCFCSEFGEDGVFVSCSGI